MNTMSLAIFLAYKIDHLVNETDIILSQVIKYFCDALVNATDTWEADKEESDRFKTLTIIAFKSRVINAPPRLKTYLDKRPSRY